MPTALLFPGQGSQVESMRELVAASAPDLVERAVEAVGEDPFARLDAGTRFVQPALYCASLALWERHGRPSADCFAGHSLGEIAALVAAGSIDPGDGLRLAAERGRLMQEAADVSPGGGMLALLGDDEAAAEIAASRGLTVANDNAPGQVVVSGPGEELERAAADAEDRGIRAIRLAVHGAFHTPAMDAALPALRDVLARIEIRPANAPVVSCITAEPFDDVRARLVQALVRPVRWRATLKSLRRLGATRFVEVGPGKVLKGLVRRTLPDAEALTLADLEPARA